MFFPLSHPLWMICRLCLLFMSNCYDKLNMVGHVIVNKCNTCSVVHNNQLCIALCLKCTVKDPPCSIHHSASIQSQLKLKSFWMHSKRVESQTLAAMISSGHTCSQWSALLFRRLCKHYVDLRYKINGQTKVWHKLIQNDKTTQLACRPLSRDGVHLNRPYVSFRIL